MLVIPDLNSGQTPSSFKVLDHFEMPDFRNSFRNHDDNYNGGGFAEKLDTLFNEKNWQHSLKNRWRSPSQLAARKRRSKARKKNKTETKVQRQQTKGQKKRKELIKSMQCANEFSAVEFDALFDKNKKKKDEIDESALIRQNKKKRKGMSMKLKLKLKMLKKKRKAKAAKKREKQLQFDSNQNKNHNHNADNSKPTKTQKKQLVAALRRNPRKRKLCSNYVQDLIKKRKFNDNEYKDADFQDKGMTLSTVHSKPNQAQKKQKKAKRAVIDKQKQILSQIKGFDLKELRIHNIPSDYDEDKLKSYVADLCSIDCADIHLFRHLTDDTKPINAIFSFRTAVICAIGYQHLLNATLGGYVLSVKPISNKYKAKHESADRNCKVIKMSNLHWKTSKKDIIRFFKATAGEPLKVNIHTTAGGYSTGEAKAEFIRHECVNRAIHQLNNTMLLDRNIKLMVGGSRQIMDTQNGIEFKGKTQQIAVFNISSDVQEDDLILFIEKELGDDCKVADVHLIHHLDLFTTGYAFCKFASYAMTNAAVEKLNGKLLSERPLRVIWGKPERRYKLRTHLAGKTNVLLLTNLRYDVTETDISQFIECATISDFYVDGIEISENEKGFRFGMAKIYVNCAEYARLIVSELNFEYLKGRKVKINYWEVREYDGGRGQAERPNNNNNKNTAKQKQDNNNNKGTGGNQQKQNNNNKNTKKQKQDNNNKKAAKQKQDNNNKGGNQQKQNNNKQKQKQDNDGVGNQQNAKKGTAKERARKRYNVLRKKKKKKRLARTKFKKKTMEWNDDWFQENVDGNGSQNKSTKNIKVPQRLLDQLF